MLLLMVTLPQSTAFRMKHNSHEKDVSAQGFVPPLRPTKANVGRIFSVEERVEEQTVTKENSADAAVLEEGVATHEAALEEGVATLKKEVEALAEEREARKAHDAAVAAARSALLDVIAPLKQGFDASSEQQKEVTAAIENLAMLAPAKDVPDISGDWEQIYTDAPDILGLDSQAGPFLTTTRIGQQISEANGTMANVIEYGPREWGSNLVWQINNDRLQQRVITSFRRLDEEPTKVNLRIKGAAFIAKQAFGISLESLPPLKLGGGEDSEGLAFGSFEVLYCEGPDGPAALETSVLDPEMKTDPSHTRILVKRTAQGYYGISRQINDPSDGWGDA
jgi:hypothetical protein